MKVKLLYFAGLRERLGQAGEEIELPPGVSTLAGLRSHLISRGGEWQSAFAETHLVRMAINQDMAEANAPVRAGDEIAFFPPVTGG